MCLGTTCNLNPALHTAIFLFACHRENFLGSKWIWIWKEWRRWRNKNPLWWGAWKIYAALKARRLVLYLSGPELSSLKAGVYQRDRRPLMCISQLVGWKLRISKAVPAYNVSAWISHLSLTKVVTKISQKRNLKKNITRLSAVMAMHFTAPSPLSPWSTPMCKTGYSQQYE